MDRIRAFQQRAINRLFDEDRLYRLCEAEVSGMRSAYGITEFFRTMHREVFREIESAREADPYRRSLQRTFIDKMGDLLKLEGDKYDRSDIKQHVRYLLRQVQLRTAKRTGDVKRDLHLADLHDRITEILDVKD
jgi:tRNA-dihydrouridine synthase